MCARLPVSIICDTSQKFLIKFTNISKLWVEIDSAQQVLTDMFAATIATRRFVTLVYRVCCSVTRVPFTGDHPVGSMVCVNSTTKHHLTIDHRCILFALKVTNLARILRWCQRSNRDFENDGRKHLGELRLDKSALSMHPDQLQLPTIICASCLQLG